MGQNTFSSVQFSHSVMSDSCHPITATREASQSINNSWNPPKSSYTESVMTSNHLILCPPLLLPSIFPSIRVFSNELALHIRWPEYWSFSFNIRPSNEHPGLISFRMDGLDLLEFQGTLKSSPAPQFKCIYLKEFIRPGLHLRPARAHRARPPLQWTLNSLLSACGNDNERRRPPPDRGTLKILSRLLIT